MKRRRLRSKSKDLNKSLCLEHKRRWMGVPVCQLVNTILRQCEGRRKWSWQPKLTVDEFSPLSWRKLCLSVKSPFPITGVVIKESKIVVPLNSACLIVKYVPVWLSTFLLHIGESCWTILSLVCSGFQGLRSRFNLFSLVISFRPFCHFPLSNDSTCLSPHTFFHVFRLANERSQSP